jgi:hypothetical protein
MEGLNPVSDLTFKVSVAAKASFEGTHDLSALCGSDAIGYDSTFGKVSEAGG